MAARVPYRSELSIERDALALLAEYERENGAKLDLPIPIEDIIENHLGLGLGLGLEFDDLHDLLGVPKPGDDSETDILGAIFFDDRRIVIDESLDPHERPRMEGRFRFTLAHEGGGHWILHRNHFSGDPNQSQLFGRPNAPSIICRTNQNRAREEWQADFFASCALMPKEFVIQAWIDCFGDSKPRRLRPCLPLGIRADQVRDREEAQRLNAAFGMSDDDRWSEIVRPIAERFQVSRMAMRIRLEKLGLILRDGQQQRLGLLNW